MNVCPECYYMGEMGVCPRCGAEMIPYVGTGDGFEEFQPPRERRIIQRWGGAIIRVTAILVVLMLMWYYSGGDILSLFVPQTGRVVPEEATFTVEKHITLTGTSGGRATYDLHVPQNNTYQTILRFRTEPQGLPVDGDSTHLEWSMRVPAGEVRTIVITYRVTARTVRQEMSSRESGTLADIPTQYLDMYIPESRKENKTNASEPARNGQEWWNDDDRSWTIDPLNPTVQQIAAELQEGRVKVYDMVTAVYDWITERYTYDRGGTKLKTCSQMLASTKGDCDDQSVLMISILRAMGIPAWLELGMLYNKQTNTWFGHGWANVLIPRAEGEPLVGQIDVVNRLFLFRDPLRITDYVDDGNGDHLMEYYIVLNSNGVSMDVSYRSKAYTDSGQVWVEKKAVPFTDAGLLVGVVVAVVALHRWALRRRS